MNTINPTTFPPPATLDVVGVETVQAALQAYVEASTVKPLLPREAPEGKPLEEPELDPPSPVGDSTVALERLLAKLLLESNAQQLSLTKERIEANQMAIHARHEEQMSKLQDSLNEASKAEKGSTALRVFSWIFTALSVVTAAAACIATGGIAVPAVVGAVVAVGMLALSESGAMETLTNALSDSIKQSFNCNSTKAEIGAQVVLTALLLTLSIGTMIGGGIGSATCLANRAISTSVHVAQAIQKGATIANGAVGLAATTTQGVVTEKRYEAQTLQADAAEISQFLTLLQTTLQNEEEALQTLLEAHQATLSSLAGMLERDTRAQYEIDARIGAMI